MGWPLALSCRSTTLAGFRLALASIQHVEPLQGHLQLAARAALGAAVVGHALQWVQV